MDLMEYKVLSVQYTDSRIDVVLDPMFMTIWELYLAPDFVLDCVTFSSRPPDTPWLM